MGEVAGIRLFTVRDKDDGLIDLRFVFTVKIGHMIAMYGFGKKLSKAKGKRAADAIEESKRLVKLKDKVAKVGTDASNAKEQKIPAGVFDVVPNEIGPASIFIGKVEKGHFSVRLSIKHKDASDDFALEVPFDGDPGELKGKTFDGEAFEVTEGTTEIAKVTLELYNIGN